MSALSYVDSAAHLHLSHFLVMVEAPQTNLITRSDDIYTDDIHM